MPKYILQPFKKFKRGGDYLKDLNPEQLEAVIAEDGPCMVIAGAGSGKTRVVTYRVAYLIDKGISSDNILLLTFTQKAAKEMLHRVSGLINTDISQLWGGTFHHLGNLILRKHALKIGYSPHYTILDGEDSKDLIEICREEVIGKEGRLFPKGEVLQDILSLSINTRQSIEKVIERKNPHFEQFTQKIKRIFKNYQRKKKEINVMDFDDLLEKLIFLFNENEKIKEYYSRSFRHILVDEYQDTNLLQWEILDALASYYCNLMVVGDDFQSIYSFRGAHFKNILEFPQKYPNAKIFTVEINYRSTPQILNFANYIISSSSYHTFKKGLKAVRKGGIKPIVVPTRDVYQQASFLAQRIYELYEEGIPLEEIAILYRAHFHSMEVQMELTRKEIPFWVRSGLRFFEQAHIKDVLSYMKIVENKKDELSWIRLLKHIPRVGPITSSIIYNRISKSPNPLKSHLENLKIPKEAQEGFNHLLHLLRELHTEKVHKNPSLMIQKIIEEDYSSYLQATYPDWQRRLEDIQQLARFAQNYSSSEGFLSELSLIGGMRAEEVLDLQGDGGVILSTVHQAKGLEWRVVFVIWLVEGFFPSYKAEAKEEREEERRLFYVALTRAKDELYLTYPLITMKSNSPWSLNSPSSFLNEVDKEAYQEWTLR